MKLLNLMKKLNLSLINAYCRRLSGCIILFTPLAIAAPDFQISELDTGKAIDQTVMTAVLKDEGLADLIVISVSEEFEKRLSLYEQSGNGFAGNASIVTPLTEDVISVDVGRYRKHDILVTFSDHEAIGYDPRTGIKQPLIRYQSIHNTPVREAVPNLDLFRDLNKDGLDDFFIPGFKGYSAYMQLADGGFSEGIEMHAPAVMGMSPGTAFYQMPVDYLADMNLDGLQDMVFWVDKHLWFYAGRADGMFGTEAISFDARVPYQYGSQQEMDREMNEKQEHSNFNAKALFRLADLDNDKITDLVVISVRSKGLLDKTMIYEIYKGRAGAAGKLVFPDEPISQIVSKGAAMGLQEKDFNGDKKVDFLLASIDIGVGKIIKGLLSSSANIEMHFYQMNGGQYPGTPNVTRDLKVKFDLSSGQVSIPIIVSADIDADGLEELIVQDGAETLQFFSGVDNERLFAEQSIDIKVDLPVSQNGGDPSSSQSAFRLVELNNDGRPDILIRHNSKTESNRIIVLLSK